MNVLLVNGSPDAHGCTALALAQVEHALHAAGVEAEQLWLGNGPVRDCIDCGKCAATGRCIFKDDAANELLQRAKTADGFVFGTPVYYAHPSGRILSVLDRAFYAGGGVGDDGYGLFAHKPAAAVAVARRAGCTASLDVLNKYLTIAQMPVVSSTYWNLAFGNGARADAEKDEEGMQTMRNLGANMAWLLRCIEAGKAAGVRPPVVPQVWTNFVR